MTFKNILVAYNASQSSQSALGYSTMMAKAYTAHLTGVLTRGLPKMLYAYGDYFPQLAMQQIEEADREHRAEIKTAFESATISMNTHMVHYLDKFGEADQKLLEIGRAFDVIIMGVEDRENYYQHMEVHPDIIARNAGRPVLVVPKNYSAIRIPKRIALAWDGRRAAARALAEAMQFLDDTSELTLINISNDEDFTTTIQPVITHLARHGITAKAIQKPHKIGSVTKILLETLSQTNAELLVMGAYEHSKLAEDLFGGVTNTVLAKSEIPVFLSH